MVRTASILAAVAVVTGACAGGPQVGVQVNLDRSFVQTYGAGAPALRSALIFLGKGSARAGTECRVTIGDYTRELMWGVNSFTISEAYLSRHGDTIPVAIRATGNLNLDHHIAVQRDPGRRVLVIDLNAQPTVRWE